MEEKAPVCGVCGMEYEASIVDPFYPWEHECPKTDKPYRVELPEATLELKATLQAMQAERAISRAIMADPKFVAILAKNIDFFLKNGHDTDPLPNK